jgi:hypothetical protein
MQLRRIPVYILLLVLIGLAIYFTYQANLFGLMDYVAYWSGGRLLIHGENPYDLERLLALQQSVGWYHPIPMWVNYPPWSLVWLLLAGSVSFQLGRAVWFFASIFLFVTCTGWLWTYLGGRQNKKWLVWLITFLWIPVILILQYGQIDPLMLLGVTGFLYFLERRKDFLAGTMLPLIAIKPHLFYLIVFAILVWMVAEKRWRVGLGAVAGTVLATLPVLWFRPGIFADFLGYFTRDYPDMITSSLGHFLRNQLDSGAVWLQYALIPLGLAWFLLYWSRQRKDWQWGRAMPWIVLVSLVTSPFLWVCDLSLGLVSILPLAIWEVGGALGWVKGALIGAVLAVPLVPLFLPLGVDDYWFIGLFLLVCVLLWRLLASQTFALSPRTADL